MAAPTSSGLLERVFAAQSTEQSRKLYNEWAKSYDSDMAEHEFIAPRLVAEAVARGVNLGHLPDQKDDMLRTKIVDAGCGTGLVGIELMKLGAEEVDGLDISEGMLDVARKTGAYKDLMIADLTKHLPIEDGAYDAVTCCGTFTHGHLGPEPLAEFVRVVKMGGVVVATVLESHWQEAGFRREIDRLCDDGKVVVIEDDIHAYRKDAGGGESSSFENNREESCRVTC